MLASVRIVRYLGFILSFFPYAHNRAMGNGDEDIWTHVGGGWAATLH